MLAGLFTKKLPFHRTPKMEDKPALVQALAMARTEAIMLVLLVAGGLAIGLRFGTLDREAWVWSATLFVQATPYAAAVYTAVRDALPKVGIFSRLRKPAIANPGDPSSGAADARRSHRRHRARKEPPRGGLSGPRNGRPATGVAASGLPPRSGRADRNQATGGWLISS
jgi:hypothetical protein